MSNFCPNCGVKMKGKFCSGCGTAPAETTSGLIGRWEAKYIDNTEGSSNITTIKYNKAPQGSGGLRKFFSGRNVMLKISDWKSFIENIRSLNTNIIIKA